MSADEPLVRDIVQRILSVARPERIILFGSVVTGEMARDIDLLVVEDDPGDQRQESVRLRERLTGLGHAFDVIVASMEWFEERKGVIGGIAYPANKNGKVIYEAALATRTSTAASTPRVGGPREGDR